MWSVLSSIGIGGLTAVIKAIQQARRDAENAETEQERIAAQERIETLQARAEIIKKAQSDSFERWVRIGFAFPFIAYVWKLVIWDKVLGLGATDNLSADLWWILKIVLGGYFLNVTAVGVTRMIRK